MARGGITDVIECDARDCRVPVGINEDQSDNEADLIGFDFWLEELDWRRQ